MNPVVSHISNPRAEMHVVHIDASKCTGRGSCFERSESKDIKTLRKSLVYSNPHEHTHPVHSGRRLGSGRQPPGPGS